MCPLPKDEDFFPEIERFILCHDCSTNDFDLIYITDKICEI